MRGVEFIDEPFEVTIKAGVALVAYPSGEKRAFPLSVFRMAVERAVKALLDFDADHEVVHIGRGKH